MENYVVAIYCFIDDLRKKLIQKDESFRKTSDAEIITTAIIAAKYFGCNMVKARAYMASHHRVIFIDKSGFNRRIHKLHDFMVTLFYLFGQTIKELNEESIYIIDSFPVRVCHNIRIERSKILKDKKLYRGKCVSKRECFFGFKVQVIVTKQGIPVDFYLLAGSKSDITGLKAMNINLPENSLLYADSAYTDYKLEDDYKEIEKIILKVERKSNSKRADKPYQAFLKKQMRKRVEISFSEIVKEFPNHIHAVTTKGFALKIFLFIFAFAIFKSIS